MGMYRIVDCPKKSKYGNKKITYDGQTFDSIAELRRYQELRLLERAKVISDLKTQVPYTLIEKSKHGREIRYIADFEYVEGGVKVVEDVKSKATVTPLYRLKKRLLAEKYGIAIREVYM